MNFKDAMDALGITAEQAADALGYSAQTVRQMRLDSENANFRSPPDNWRAVFAELAKKRGGEMAKLARELGQ